MAGSDKLWAVVGKIGILLAAIAAFVAIYQAYSKETPELIARCYSVPNRVSLEPLVKRDVDAQTEISQVALKEALAKETWTQTQKDAFLSNVERIERSKDVDTDFAPNDAEIYG